MTRKYLIYIAGALNADAVGYIQNFSRMMEWAEKVRKQGYSVFVPALDILMGLKAGDWVYEDYFWNNQEMLLRSDAVFVVPGYENSKGTALEIKHAHTEDIPVFYTIEDLVANIKEDAGV